MKKEPNDYEQKFPLEINGVNYTFWYINPQPRYGSNRYYHGKAYAMRNDTKETISAEYQIDTEKQNMGECYQAAILALKNCMAGDLDV